MLCAALYAPPVADAPLAPGALVALAGDFSPRYESHGDRAIAIDVSGLGRLLGDARTIGAELRRSAAARGVRVHVAVAPAWTPALVLAHARAGLTIVAPGDEAVALAPVSIGLLETLADAMMAPGPRPAAAPRSAADAASAVQSTVAALRTWGVRTLGEFAALPAADVAARLGRRALAWQGVARGDEMRPLVPVVAEERFEGRLELEWPIEGLEPLSFVLTRLLEPLSIRLERRDRGAAVLHVILELVTRANAEREVHARRLELPAPMRDVRTLRTLALLDLESHPPAASIDAVTVAIDPTPGRIVQHTLYTRPLPTPEQASTLLARLCAVMGADRVGAPARVDTFRPGAFAMRPFATTHAEVADTAPAGRRGDGASPPVFALRRCRQPVPARVVVEAGEPARVTTDRRGFAGGRVLHASGPWRSSGSWWDADAGQAWNRDEWDVTLSDGVYRIFQDRDTHAWFIDAVVD